MFKLNWYHLRVVPSSEETVSEFYRRYDIDPAIATLGYALANCTGTIIGVNKENENDKIIDVSANMLIEGNKLLMGMGKINSPWIHHINVVRRTDCIYLPSKIQTQSNNLVIPSETGNKSPYWLSSAIKFSMKPTINAHSFLFNKENGIYEKVSGNQFLMISYKAITSAVILLTLPVDFLVALIVLPVAAVHDFFTSIFGNQENTDNNDLRCHTII